MTQVSNPLFGLSPSSWVERHATLIAPGARVLDVAAGHGRQSIFLAARGARVLAVDRDAAALASFADRTGIVITNPEQQRQSDWRLKDRARHHRAQTG